MRTISLYSVSFSLLALLACSEQVTRDIGGHKFQVPEANDVKGSDTPFFFPTPMANEGFSFVLNPDAPLAGQILIAVARKADVCRRARGTQADVNSSICSPRPCQWRQSNLLKTGDEVFWQYRLPETLAEGAPVVIRCTQNSKAAKTGLCTAVLPYREELTLTIHTTDEKVGSLAAIYDEAASKLTAWELEKRTD